MKELSHIEMVKNLKTDHGLSKTINNTQPNEGFLNIELWVHLITQIVQLLPNPARNQEQQFSDHATCYVQPC